MTITSLDNSSQTPTAQDVLAKLASIISDIATRMSDYREIRKAGKPRAFYHNHKAKNLERAHRDVNRVWRHHF